MSHTLDKMVASRFRLRACIIGMAAALSLYAVAMNARAQSPTSLADQPVFTSLNVPGNLALTLSVEFPTAISVANLGDYSYQSTYLGYFDPVKCYNYVYNTTTPSSSYFQPASFATGTYLHQCSGQWSGNFMNWATMQTIDPFRWALSGGYRNVDSTTMTVLEKAWGSNQGSSSNFPDKGTDKATGNYLPTASVPNVTPFTAWTSFALSIWSQGNRMLFRGIDTSNGGPNNWTGTALQDQHTLYQVYIRVRVCDATTTMGVAGLESNCTHYGATGSTNYKPEGLLQQYSNKIRFSAFSYLNGLGSTRQGGVLREPMGYIGPTYPQPLSTSVTTNSRPEWDATTGIMSANPDSATATASGVSQSGVMNYLNKFGEASQSYMTYDNVSELYYAAIRYFENLGNVPEWTNSASTTELDGFPAVTSWVDPIIYSCQKNFILGIGDDHTWDDYNVGGATAGGSRVKPSAVSADTLNQTETWTANLQRLQGITVTDWWAAGAGSTTYYIAGLAYGTHVVDIRPDLAGTQNISTYWMDVAEYQEVENLNPYYLATKFGGFSVPSSYSISNSTTPLTQSWWDTSGNSIYMNGTTQPQPDNYFLAGNAGQMVAGLKSAFTNIVNAIKSYTTSFSLSSPTVASSGATSFAAQYDSTTWSSVITASTLSIASDGTPSVTTLWTTSSTLETQLAGAGWDTGRNVATWSDGAGVAFRYGNLDSSQQTALVPTAYSSSTTGQQYLNYLRGDRTNEVGSAVTGSTKSLRARTLLLGDIVDSKLTAVAAPVMSYSEATNPGYATFKSTYASRPTMVYVGANDGMLHAFNGSTGAEQFAYVPSAVFQGPNSTPQVDGLAQLGNPNYAHHFYVDATPLTFDVDFSNVGTGWHTLLVGGLGKGGKSFYALDVTDPASMSSESALAGKVLWEFTDSTMGYSFGAPVAVKTKKYGWVVVLTSGYDNSDGYGYLYLVNPSTGALLEKIKTPSASNGLTQASAYVKDYTDYTADSVYVGDLSGNLWRFDLTALTGSYPTPTLLAKVADSSGTAQPITSPPLIEIYPTTRKRFVLFGTGQLLSSSDIASAQVQSFYAIIDGTAGSFNTVSTPITRSNLTPVTDVTAGVTLSATSKGWYTDLGATSGIGWRDISSAVAYNGIVAFTTLLTSGDACSPSGQSRVYAVDYSMGKSALTSNTTGYISYTVAVTDLRFINDVSTSGVSTPELIAGNNGGGITQVPTNLAATVSTRLLNWREVPTAD